MKTLYESLLDDFEDLEKKSDMIVNKRNTIGSKYSIKLIEDRYMKLDSMNKIELKQYPILWEQDKCSVTNRYGLNHNTDKYILMLVNALLSFNIKSLDFGNYSKDNEIFNFFNSIFKNIVKVKGCKYNLPGVSEIDLEIISKDKWWLNLWLVEK